MSDPAPIPAATLVLVRDRAAGPPELLMLQRAATLDFAGGAWVFPGGRVDPDDRVLAAGADDPEEGAARVAAIRETIEEAGVAVGLSPAPDRATLARLRAGLAAGTGFAALLAAARLTLDPSALVLFARWLPPEGRGRRFDTRFYLARAPADAAARGDGGECVAARWTDAATMLAGDAAMIFPTRANLIRLAPFADFAAMAAAARALPVRPLTVLIEPRDGVPHRVIPPGYGYPDLAEPVPG